MQSEVKKIFRDLGSLKKILFFLQELKLLFSWRTIYQTIIQIKNVSMCLNIEVVVIITEDEKTK